MPIDAPDVVGRLDVSLLQLQRDEASGKRDDTDVVARIGLYCHDVALLQVEVVHVVVVSLACILELHLNEVGFVGVSRHVGQPVVGVELSVLSSTGFRTESSVGSHGDFEFHIFEVHVSIFIYVMT